MLDMYAYSQPFHWPPSKPLAVAHSSREGSSGSSAADARLTSGTTRRGCSSHAHATWCSSRLSAANLTVLAAATMPHTALTSSSGIAATPSTRLAIMAAQPGAVSCSSKSPHGSREKWLHPPTATTVG